MQFHSLQPGSCCMLAWNANAMRRQSSQSLPIRSVQASLIFAGREPHQLLHRAGFRLHNAPASHGRACGAGCCHWNWQGLCLCGVPDQGCSSGCKSIRWAGAGGPAFAHHAGSAHCIGTERNRWQESAEGWQSVRRTAAPGETTR